jgi:DNA-binding PadR family transcriptional regulator
MSPCGYIKVEEYSEGKNIPQYERRIYRSMREEDDSVAEIIADLEKMHEAGLVEVKSITEEGEWLYGLTDLGRSLVQEIGTDPDRLEDLRKVLAVMMDKEKRDNS